MPIHMTGTPKQSPTPMQQTGKKTVAAADMQTDKPDPDIKIEVQYLNCSNNWTPWVLTPGEKNRHVMVLTRPRSMTVLQLRDKIAAKFAKAFKVRNAANIRLYKNGKLIKFNNRVGKGKAVVELPTTLEDESIADGTHIFWTESSGAAAV